jgi:putative PIG3 family NAD(P)H quinone oxidoreductase
MRAVVITRPGGPEVLELRELPVPKPSRNDVRVRVRATAVNRADVAQRIGAYPAPPGWPADVPGLEYAGEVEAIGRDVTEHAVGDRVFGLVGGGAYADFVVAHERTVVPMPTGFAFVEAAAVPEAFITAYDAMVTQAGLRAGEHVLVHAVGSGVGTAAVQLAGAIGARSIGTARTPDKLERARALGLDEGLVPAKGAFAESVRTLTDGRGVDVVLELVGGAYVAEDLACLAPCGRLVVVGLMAGSRVDLDLATLLKKRIVARGTVLRSRPLEERIGVAQAFARHVVPLLAEGRVRPVVDRVMTLSQAADAHALLASNEGFGKVVLTV